jgi:Concanavalin A-like lectin/glucanases superfamily/Bacterial Ig domain
VQLYWPSNSSRIVLRHYFGTTNDLNLQSPTGFGPGVWHHVAVVYNRTNTDVGDFELYLNGALVGTSNGIAMAVDQSFPVVFGGHAHSTNNTSRWFDGRLDEVAIFRNRLNAAQIDRLTTTTVAHLGGLMTNNVINVTVAPVNDAPTLASISNRTLGAGQTLTLTNVATDPEVPATQAFTFTLLNNPTGAVLGASSGILTWRPSVARANTTNLFRVRVADNGAPSLSATQQFNVIVNPLADPRVLSVTNVSSGLRLRIDGDDGPDYIVQATTNMADWTNLLTTNSPNVPFNWTDANTGSFLQRFYRVLLGP